MAQALYGGSTPSESSIKRRRRLSEALLSQATDASPKGHWTQALAQGLNGYMAGRENRIADKEEASRSQALAEALSGGKSPEELMALSAQYGAPELMQGAQFQYGKSRDAADDAWKQKTFDYGVNQDNRNFGLEREKFDWQKNAPPTPTDDMREFEYSQQTPGFADYQQSLKKAGATNITNSVNAGENSLRKKLSEKEGEGWAGYLDSANVSGSTVQDLTALDELLKVAPQGPIAGRLAEMFPGFSSAGDAAQSIVVRVAPTLRTPGSGATSDIEYEGMLKSLPRLRNSPQGNQIISGVMKAKAQLNVERGQIVAAYQNGQIDDQTARAKMQELNQRSIMSPDVKALLGGDQAAPQPDNDIDMLLQKYGGQ